MAPDNRNREHKESIFLIQPFGRRKVEVQKFTIPVITVFIRKHRLANERDFVAHRLNLMFSLSMRGIYSRHFQLLVHQGQTQIADC